MFSFKFFHRLYCDHFALPQLLVDALQLSTHPVLWALSLSFLVLRFGSEILAVGNQPLCPTKKSSKAPASANLVAADGKP